MAANKDTPQEEQEEATGGNKKKLIIIIVGVLLLMGISVGVTIMLVGGDKSPETPEVVEEVVPEKEDPNYIELKAFTVNLGPNDPVGFLQIQINVLTYFSEVAEEIETHMPLIRNNLTLLFGEQNSADLRSREGKEQLQLKAKQSIQQVINKYGNGGEVDNVFFTNFVMQ